MARPKKDNLDYFSHDKDMRNDLKIKALRRKFSHKGYSIYVMMLEHLSNCDYLQYEWNELSIELLTPDFDIDSEELKDIINYCVFLKLFEIELGYIFSQKFYERNKIVLGGRDGFSLINSPIMKLKQNKLPDNGVNPELTIVNPELIHRVKDSKLKENKVEESIVQESIVEDSKLKVSTLKNNKLNEQKIRVCKQLIEEGQLTNEQILNLDLSDVREMISLTLDNDKWETEYLSGQYEFQRRLEDKNVWDYQIDALIKLYKLL